MADEETPKGEDKAFSQADLEAAVAKATEGMKTKMEELLGETKAAKAKAREIEDAKAKAEEEAARKAGDTEALEKSWSEKLAKEVAGRDGEIESLRSVVNSLTVGAEAARLAGEIAVPGSAKVLERFARDRLTVEMDNGQARLRILDADGKPSAMTIDDLKQEFASDDGLKPLIVGSKASGGGAANANGSAGQPVSKLVAKVPKLAELPEK